MTGFDLGDLTASDAVTAAVTGFFLWLVARTKAKGGEEGTADASQQVVDQMESWTDKRLAENEKWTKRLLNERDQRIGRLEKRVSTLEAKYRAALASIRRLLQRHPESSDAVADEVRNDL
ncbi:Hypothetical protein CGLY_12225 [Corynebacterium glyciniphilum AJ 3170]|uniref:Uncharacterized protein n=1 Tax=Corynebacterium glyciniphilum AJ 3170 TaxID=1404245 RepID=X5EBW4_9CORY|nr:hypothetical protein [Corynebacterium glyciniphilum]AHW64885.1 Hypothetical protein CGLY_12225 [Corynebacterium glyciniphilum AJ 3170]